jgi:succinate dehydrogenase flavin-adding protein (antitoxin of CptAB toxin-antitoxin module)
MSESELDAFELLLDAADHQALAWIVGGEAPPRGFDAALIARLRGA